jgi:hypothetical protein
MAAKTGTYTLIASSTLTTSTTTVTFSSIPATYTDLRIVTAARSDAGDRVSSYYFDLNGLTTSIYSRTNLTGNGSSASSARASNQGLGQIGTITGSVSTSNIFPVNTMDILDYSNSTTFKTVLTRTNLEQPTAGFEVGAIVNLVRTTNAITSVKFYCVGNFVAGSTFRLYGIEAAK